MITSEQDATCQDLARVSRGPVQVREGYADGTVSAVTKDGVEHVLRYDGTVRETRFTTYPDWASLNEGRQDL